MKNFKTIFKFELDNYFKSKSYMIMTILIAIIAGTLMFIPRIIDSVKGPSNISGNMVIISILMANICCKITKYYDTLEAKLCVFLRLQSYSYEKNLCCYFNARIIRLKCTGCS